MPGPESMNCSAQPDIATLHIVSDVSRPIDLSAREPDAVLDPWCLVPADDETSLYGFAITHPATGGLSWLLSTSVLVIDEALGRALTRSGRLYALRQRITVATLPTEEARIAYALIAGPYLGIEPAVLIGELDESVARQWVIACKISRHLGVEAPLRDHIQLADFFQRHSADYAGILQHRRSR